MNTPSDDVLLATIVEIIRDLTALKVPIGKETRLLADLSIGGDDAFDLLMQIHKRFGTSFKSMQFGRFFPQEHETLSYHWFSWLYPARSLKDTITIAHLVEVVKSGSWFDPPSTLK